MAGNTDNPTCFEEIRAYSQEHLGQLAGRGFAHAEKQCTELLSSADVDTDEKDIIDSARQYLFENKSSLISTFTEQFNLALLGEKDDSESNKADTLSLALVDDDTLDEMIIIGELCGKIQDHYDSHLKALKRGLVRLSKKMDFEPEPDALTPKKLLQLLHEPLGQSELSLDSKKHIYRPFADAAQVELKTVYDGILALLQESQIISEPENPASANYKIIYQYRQTQGGAGGASAPAQPTPAANVPQAGEMAAPPAQALGPAGGSAIPQPGGMPGPAGASAVPQPGGIPGPAGGAAIPQPGLATPHYGSVPQVAPASLSPVAASAMNPSMFQSSEASQAVYGFLNRQPAPQQADAGAVPLPTVDSTELLRVLSSLQNLNTLDLAQAALKDSASIGQQVNEAISSKTSEWSKQLSTPEANVIELVNNMFTTIFEEPDLIDPVKVQIGRLQIPYIKVAILDVTLLDQEAHPARLLLNELAALGVRISNPDEPLMDLISSVIKNVLNNFESDLSVFSTNLEQLRAASKTQEEEALAAEKGTRQKAESQAKLLHVKKHIVAKLRQHLKGKILPKEVHGLLLKGFAPLLLKIYRQGGEESEDWKNTLFLLRQIIESVQPRDSSYQLDAVLGKSSVIIKDAQSAIQLLPKKMVDNSLVNGLKKIYADLADKQESLKSTQEEEPEEIRIDPLALDPDEEPEPDPASLNQPTPEELLKQLPPQVQAGAWCEVYMGRNEEPRRLKVSTILESSAQIVFVDNTGVKSEIKDIQDFVDELDCERSRVLPSDQLFDKALSAVINNMNLMRAV